MKARGLQKSKFLYSLVNWKKIGSVAKAFQKSQFSVSFMNWENLESIHSPRLTFQSPHFESMDELRKVMP